MNLSIPRTTLTDLASWAARAIPSKPTNVILAGLRLSLADGQLAADGFDYEVHARGTAELDAETFVAIVPGRMFAATLANLDGDTVTLTVDDAGRRMELKCGRVKAAFPLLPLLDYPSLPSPVEALGTIESGVLADAVAAVAPMAARDVTSGKVELTAIVLTAEFGELTLAATDGYQMARVVLPWSGPDGQVLVSAAHLVDACKNLSGTVSLGWSGDGADGSFTLSASGRSMTMRTVPGVPPAFGRFFDVTEHETVLYARTDELAAAVRRVDGFIPDKAPLVVTLLDDGVEVSGAGNVDSSCTDTVDATVKGALHEVGMKPAFLLAALASLSSPFARVALNGATKPIRFDASEEEGSEPSSTRTCVVMPVRLGDKTP